MRIRLSRRTKTVLAPLVPLFAVFGLFQLLARVVYSDAPLWVGVIAVIWSALTILYLLALTVFGIVRFIKWAARD